MRLRRERTLRPATPSVFSQPVGDVIFEALFLGEIEELPMVASSSAVTVASSLHVEGETDGLSCIGIGWCAVSH